MKTVRVGVATFILRIYEGRVLLLKRKSEHGKGTWGAPGGHMEVGETPCAAARREVLEETGMDVIPRPLESLPYVSTVFPDGSHYITLYFTAVQNQNSDRQNPQLLEPDKIEKFLWAPIDALPAPLFDPIPNHIYLYLEREMV